MMTWLLWRALRRPYNQHPRYAQIITRRARQQPLRLSDILPMPRFLQKGDLWGILGGALMVLLFCSGGWLILFPLVILTPVLMLGSGTLYGVFTAVWTSTDFAIEREKNRLAVAAVTPGGTAGLLWATTSARQQSTTLLVQMRNLALGVFLGLLFMLALILAIALLNWLTTRPFSSLLNDQPDYSSRNLAETLRFFIVVSALYVDFVQSAVIGTLTGFYAATYGLSRLNAGGLAFGAFLLTQFSSYALGLLLAFLVVPQALAGMSLLVVLAAQVALFLSLRELLVYGLWRLTVTALQADAAELRLTFGLTLPSNPHGG